jgi:hypothetical protein
VRIFTGTTIKLVSFLTAICRYDNRTLLSVICTYTPRLSMKIDGGKQGSGVLLILWLTPGER